MPIHSRQYYKQHYSQNFYNAWTNMRRRCDNPSKQDIKNYRERGITYEVRWDWFEEFHDDMSNGYLKGLSLDRINNDKGYSKENCRWATPQMQNNNTRANRNLTINGETKTLAQWCRLSSVKPNVVKSRFYNYGWTIEQALGFAKKEG